MSVCVNLSVVCERERKNRTAVFGSVSVYV